MNSILLVPLVQEMTCWTWVFAALLRNIGCLSYKNEIKLRGHVNAGVGAE